VLILASASQSRKNLLKNSNFNFIQIPSEFDESLIKEENIQELTLKLSSSKAKYLLKKLQEDLSITSKFSGIDILGCDSIFEYKGEAFGKPSNKKEAFERWKNLSGSYGYLHTGHCLFFCDITENKKAIILRKDIKNVISSKIYFSKLSNEEILEYVETLEPLKCAGGFALEGIGGKYIERIEGCFSNVMGLSLPWLRRKLLSNKI
tara:strand:+ start:2098 stop:2715 length:618 start_codon:yes stop_codon:yes gene_type:complete